MSGLDGLGWPNPEDEPKFINDEGKIKKLSDLLNECLESCNQERSFSVRGIENGKFVVEFNIVEVEEDNYIGFAGY